MIGTEENISVTTFANKMKLNMNQVSETFFRRSSTIGLDTHKNMNHTPKDCIICFSNESSILLRPCNHCGICRPCIELHLKKNRQCPICKGEIDQVFILQWDSVKKEYVTNQMITIDN